MSLLPRWLSRSPDHIYQKYTTVADRCKTYQKTLDNLRIEGSVEQGQKAFLWSDQSVAVFSKRGSTSSKLFNGTGVFCANDTHVLVKLWKPLEVSFPGVDMEASQVVVPRVAFGSLPSSGKKASSISGLTDPDEIGTGSKSPPPPPPYPDDRPSRETFYSGSGKPPNAHEAYFLGWQKGTGTGTGTSATETPNMTMCLQTTQHHLSIQRSQGDTEESKDRYYSVHLSDDNTSADGKATHVKARSQSVLGTIETCDLYKFALSHQERAGVEIVGPLIVRSNSASQPQVGTTRDTQQEGNGETLDDVQNFQNARVTWFELRKP